MTNRLVVVFDDHNGEMVGNTHRFLGKFLDVEGEVAQVELLAKLEVVHLVKHTPLDRLGKFAHLFLKEIDAMGLLTHKTRCLEVVARSLDGAFNSKPVISTSLRKSTLSSDGKNGISISYCHKFLCSRLIIMSSRSSNCIISTRWSVTSE